VTIYFDHNATTPLNGRVLEEMLPFFQTGYANPSSLHMQGRMARNALDIAREQVAALVNAHPTQVIFTSGGTEANNLAISGTMKGMGLNRLTCSAIEHPSVRDVVGFHYRTALASGRELTVNSSGYVSNSLLSDECEQKPPMLVSIMLANNETGVIQDIAGLAEIIRSCDHYVHTDAIQAVGKIPVDFVNLGCHLMTISSHKFYGPKGVGALVYDKSLDVEPMVRGGGQEKNLRSGTENVAAIVGFGKAAEIAKADLERNQYYLKGLQHYFESKLKQFSGITLFSESVNRLPNTLFFSVPGVSGEALLMQLDDYDIAVTSGSACASKSELPSHVLLAMGVDEPTAKNAIRISFGLQNTKMEIDKFFGVFEMILSRNRQSLVL